jgi:hypothetical protein
VNQVQQTEEITALAAALAAAQAEFDAVGKASDNPFFHSKYADLPTIMRAVGPVLAKHGLAVTQHPGYATYATGGITDPSREIVDTITTRIVHTSGEWMQSTMLLHLIPDKSGHVTPQAQGSAITYARRYALSAALGIVTDVDDDGNQASQGPALVNEDQRKALAKAAHDAGLTPADARKVLQEAVGVDSTAEVPVSLIDTALAALEDATVLA